jgi:hypothetical protein
MILILNVSLFFVYSLTMPKFILKNNVALINGKDEVIYGHVGLCTGSLTEQHDIF